MKGLVRWMALAGLASALAACASPGPDMAVAGGGTRSAGLEAFESASAAGAYLAGREAQARHDISGAAFYLGKAAEANPENVEILQRATIALAVEGRIGEAAALAGHLENFDGEATIPVMLLAEQAAKRGDWKGVEILISRLPNRDINLYLLPLLHAWADTGQGQIDDALKALDSFDAKSGLTVLRDFNRAMINDIADRRDAAEQSYAATVAVPAGRTIRTIEVTAGFYQRVGKNEAALDLAKGFVHQHPDLPIVLVNDRRLVDSAMGGLAEAFFGAAGTLRQDNAPEISLLFCRLALDLNPDFPLAQLMAGDLLSGLGQYAASTRAYLSLKEDSPLQFSARMRIAHNEEEMGRPDEAAKLLEDMAAKKPEQPEALLALGDMWRRLRRWTQAVGAYDRAIPLVKAPERSLWPVYYARGVAEERSNQWPRAEADLLHALELEPNEPQVLNYLGYTWIEQGANLERATQMIQKAVDLRPSDGFIVDSLGWAFYRGGDYPKAVETLQRAVTLVPGDATINDHLGDALWSAGRREEARFQWQHALLFDPDPELKAQLGEKLKR